jgi:hypothetical protein
MRRTIIVVLAVVGALLAFPAAAQAHPALEPRIDALEAAVAALDGRVDAVEAYDTYVATDNVTIVAAANGFSNRTATCNTGDFATGGGYRVEGGSGTYDPAFRILNSYPFVNGSPVGWTVSIINGTGTDVDLETFVVCLDK